MAALVAMLIRSEERREREQTERYTFYMSIISGMFGRTSVPPPHLFPASSSSSSSSGQADGGKKGEEEKENSKE